MDADYVRDALLQFNYFPRHRTKSAEMPPFFDTTSLTAPHATAISNVRPYLSSYKGCDFVPYTITRFNGGPRLCGLPHPYPYCRLVDTIFQNWEDIEKQIESNSSQILPQSHKDGRIFVMDYDSQFTRSKAYLDKQSCKSFVAKTDISHFYPSIYTHSIAWAVVGVEAAKSNTNGSIWYNRLDVRTRECKRNETNGILIGPGTSSLVAEMILSTIDRELENKGFSFLRFIDDYTCFCESREDASKFIDTLEKKLSKYSLYLNFGKTYIEPLIGSELPEWVTQLQCESLGESANFFSLKLFFSRAIALSEKHPDGSVLRYAAHSLKGRNLDQVSGEYVLRTLLSLSMRHLHLSPCINDFLHFGMQNGAFKYQNELESVLQEAVRKRRSDAICWLLYIFKSCKITVDSTKGYLIVKTYDPCALAILYEVGDTPTKRAITRYSRKHILARDHTVLERNWFLVHYLLNSRVIKESEVTDLTLVYMMKNKINLFIK